MHREISVSVVIVNYNSAAFTEGCLLSIVPNARESCTEIIVIDNASYDGCGEMIAAEFPMLLLFKVLAILDLLEPTTWELRSLTDDTFCF